MEKLSTRLKKARFEKHWTQAELALNAGVSTGTIGNIESDVRKAKGSIPQIAEALGVNYAWLQKGEGEMYPAKATSELVAPGGYLTSSGTNSAIDITQVRAEKKSASLHLALQILFESLQSADPAYRGAISAMFQSLTQNPNDYILQSGIESMLTKHMDDVKKKVV